MQSISISDFRVLVSGFPKALFAINVLINLMVGVIEVAGVASIMPLIAIISDPQIMDNNQEISTMYNFINIFGSENSIGVFATFTLLVFSLSILTKAFARYFGLHFNLRFEFLLTHRLLTKYLSLSNRKIITKNKTELGATILTEVGQAIDLIVNPIILIVANSIIIICYLSFLIYLDPMITVLSFVIIVSVYLTLFNFVKYFLSNIGRKRLLYNKMRFNRLTELFLLLRELKVYRNEGFFVERFYSAAKNYMSQQALGKFASELPRYIVEFFVFGGVIGIVVFLAFSAESHEIFALAAAYALAAMRIMPSTQNIYLSISNLRLSRPLMKKFVAELSLPSVREYQPYSGNTYSDPTKVNNRKLDRIQLIEVDRLGFSYSGLEGEELFWDLSFEVKRGAVVGIVGESGSGKSTLISCIMGLLKPASGGVAIVTESGRNIPKDSVGELIGYVPQDTTVMDSTLKENILLDLDYDEAKYEKVLATAALEKFQDRFSSEDITLGDSGSRLSGGQKQRIGIARALYRDPQILIMDEGTSALDINTEKKIMEEILCKFPELIVLLVTHRSSTLAYCDMLVQFEEDGIRVDGPKN